MNDEGPHTKGPHGGVYYTRGKKGTYWINYNDRGKETRQSTGTTDKATAIRMLEAATRKVIVRQETGKPPEVPKRITISKALEQFEIEKKLHNTWNDTYISDCGLLKARFGNILCSAFSKQHYQQYQQEKKASCKTSMNSTLNRRLIILTQSIRLCGITPLYEKDMKTLHLPEPEPRQDYFEPHEFRILLSALPDYAADIALCLYLTGWRISEVAGTRKLKKYVPGLLFSEMQGDSIRIPGPRVKNRRAKQLPLTGELLALIEKRKKLKVPGCDYIFHHNGKPVMEFRGPWMRACKLAGKPQGRIHDLRRSRARTWIRAGVNERTAMEAGGWRTREIFDRYNIVSDADMKVAQEKAEEYLQQEVEKQVKKGSTAVN